MTELKTTCGYSGLKTRLSQEISVAAEQELKHIDFVHRSSDRPESAKGILAEVLKELRDSLGAEAALPEVSLISGRPDRRRAPDPLSEHGCIQREDNVVVVRKAGDARLLEISGVTCENPDAPEPQRIYRKEFRNKKIYLPDELDQARRETLNGRDTFIMGMTGFSMIGAENCERLGITEEAYVNACADVFGSTIKSLQSEFPGIRIKIVDGASNLGVDKASIAVAKELNLDSLGFSCPRFMFYVEDTPDKPVYVARTQQEYSLAFIRSLDLLFSVGGRLQALKFDMLAAVDEAKRMVRLNILKAISPYGGLPARDAKGNIQDATTAFEEAVLGTAPVFASGDLYQQIRNSAAELSKLVARRLLDPERAYSKWRREA